MIIEPKVTELLKIADNRFELVIATAKRARRLAEGEKCLTIFSMLLLQQFLTIYIFFIIF